MMKLVLAGSGLAVGPFRVLPPGREPDAATLDAVVADLGLPLFVKPARAGSSLGISRVDDKADLADAIAAARVHDPKVIVEAALFGREVECGVLGGRSGAPPRASLPGEIVVTDARHSFYDFEAKYLDEAGVTLSCPADLPDDVVARVQDVAVRAFEAVGCEGLARVDVFVTPDGEVVVNEINTMRTTSRISDAVRSEFANVGNRAHDRASIARATRWVWCVETFHHRKFMPFGSSRQRCATSSPVGHGSSALS